MATITYRRNTLALVLAAFTFWSYLFLETSALDLRSFHDSLQARYSRAHSLGDDNYQFDPRDGWQTVNASNLQYKYDNEDRQQARDSLDNLDGLDEDAGLLEDTGDGDEPGYLNDTLTSRSDKKKAKKPAKTSKPPTKSKVKAKSKSKVGSATSSFTSKLGSIVDSIKGIGKAEPVAITWYTGHDLENPSCWSNPTWAPTVCRCIHPGELLEILSMFAIRMHHLLVLSLWKAGQLVQNASSSWNVSDILLSS